jgi:CRISPR/Cas system CSM-associated protein Csm2 small subunit
MRVGSTMVIASGVDLEQFKKWKKMKFFSPSAKNRARLQGFAEMFEVYTSSIKQIGLSPEQIQSKRFKKFHNFLNCLQKP